jgi:response regulator RpfG family c-di-GMP phosphodiesterase
LEDRLKGLNSGSDDYLVNPFDVSELVARAKGDSASPGAGSIFTFEFSA